jgi:hypothetical protein
MSKKAKPLPPFIPSDELSKFVEKNTSLPKSELIGRMAGHPFLQLMKLLQFNQISKDDSGHLSLF